MTIFTVKHCFFSSRHFLDKSEVFFLCKRGGTYFWLFDKMEGGVFENVLAESLALISLTCISPFSCNWCQVM